MELFSACKIEMDLGSIPIFRPDKDNCLVQFTTYNRMILLRGDHAGHERNQHLHNFKEQTRYTLPKEICFPFDRD